MNHHFNEDCKKVMARYPDGHFDLAIVDPPYGIKQDGHRENNCSKIAKTKNYHKALWDMASPDEEYFSLLFAKSKNQIIWGANHFIESIPINTPCWIVWDKDNAGSNFADCELAWTSFDTAVRMFKYRWNGMLQGNMKDKEERIHPTQKPVALYRWLLQNYATPGAKILDTHLGSGSSAIAAHRMGFEFVGCEIEEVHFTDMDKRFKKEITKQEIDFSPARITEAEQKTMF